MRIIVDADPAVYRAGFASQTSLYVLVYETPDGGLVEDIIEGDPRDHKKARAKAGYELLNQTTRVKPKDVAIARFSLNAQLKGIYRECCNKMCDMPERGMEVILSGTGNYRNEIATVMGYKANRLKMVKPYHYNTIREHLTARWGAVLVDGREADDEVAIRMTEARDAGEPAVLVTIDKDLDQIPGVHYDYKNHVFYDVDEEEGVLLFHAQILSGDTTDNIPGLRGFGPARALTLVRTWQGEWLRDRPGCTLEEYLWAAVVSEYTDVPLGLPGDEVYTGEKSPAELALEMARLVWLQRVEGQLWQQPSI